MRLRLNVIPMLLVPVSVLAVERATFNSSGCLASLITGGREIGVRSEFVMNFTGGPSSNVAPGDQRANSTRHGTDLTWQGLTTFANGGKASYKVAWTESDNGVALDATITPESGRGGAPMLADSLEFVVDLPRDEFAGWLIGRADSVLPGETKPSEPVFHHETTGELDFSDPRSDWKLSLKFDRPREVSIEDIWRKGWSGDERYFRVRVRIEPGPLQPGVAAGFGATFRLTGTSTAEPAHVTVDPGIRLYRLDGFGGNYCFTTQTPVADFMLDQLHQAWARLEFKAQLWDRERNDPGPVLTRDFELMQRIDRMGIPWVLSLWRLPERYYSDPNEHPPGTFNRKIAADMWPEFLDLLGSYLLHLKHVYGAEPNFFSFNEPDLGVDIGFTPGEHRDAIRRIGSHLESLGLKTKMLVGDTANPRDSHRYVLPTAAAADAMRYVGAVSFHSWNGGTPDQYRAWRDVARWTGLPLIVAEAGTDPGAYKNRIFNSYAFGLGEMRQYQELLRDAQPAALIFWEFTEDYGLAFPDASGKVVPTSRFFLMKHFTNLTPMKSDCLSTTSDQADVLVSAFGKQGAVTVHILNLGAGRDVSIAGLPAGAWKRVTTTETVDWDESAFAEVVPTLNVPARSFTTLVLPK